MFSKSSTRYLGPLSILIVASIASGQLKTSQNFMTNQQQQQQLQQVQFQQQPLDFSLIRQQQRQQLQQQQQQQPQQLQHQSRAQQQQLQQQQIVSPKEDQMNPPKSQNSQLQQPKQQQQQQQQPMKSRQLTVVQPLIRDGIRVTLTEPSNGFTRIENMMSMLDRVAYAISKPVTIINVVRFVTLALSSLIMSSFIFPTSALFDISKKKTRDRFQMFNPLNHITRQDVENVIDSISRNYDDTLDRAGLLEKSSCRERTLCVLGDMVSCEFPNVVVSAGKFAQNHLPPIDSNRNKYSKALMMGLNQTDCDRAFKLSEYDCPTFREYVRSYFYTGSRRRRDKVRRKY